MVRWDERLEIGNVTIDAQHRELFERVGQFDEALVVGDRDAIGRTLAYLREYALDHFETEERFMRAARYPGYDIHKGKHDAFVQRLVALCAEHEEHGVSAILTLRMQNWIAHWLEVHVAEEDVALGRFLATAAA